MAQQFHNLLRDGVTALNTGNSAFALRQFEKAAELDTSPELYSYLAFCLAKEKKNISRAITLGRNALAEETWNSLHYLNLGRIYLLAGKKQDAIRTFRDGLLHENNYRLRDELARLGIRKYPVIPSLPREHLLNRVLGRLFKQLKLR